jgi:hypothetical protein
MLFHKNGSPILLAPVSSLRTPENRTFLFCIFLQVLNATHPSGHAPVRAPLSAQGKEYLTAGVAI